LYLAYHDKLVVRRHASAAWRSALISADLSWWIAADFLPLLAF
jgi:hypothetical protein